ncbi:uncharacterized protein LOC125230603 isoform X3 [Leguminivora glycinivorella]|uniref:uncharacterized protein LOC125230603 isoform X3 n=1 Tax=Leguminivora glycinivorella TaxID=1035111 RepID=UPI00200E4212|nr:uncharacterized protein LOC125230603 isoform X3 [Leguminivora glycinivorella]
MCVKYSILFLLCAVFLSSYAATYRSRSRRQLAADTDPFDAAEVEKYIVGEFGARACVFERVCAHYAARAQRNPKPRWTGQTYSATTSVRPTKRRTSTC